MKLRRGYEVLLLSFSLHPVLQRLCHMRRLDLVASREVSDGARELDDAVVAPRREMHFSYGLAQEFRRSIVQCAIDPEVAALYITVRYVPSPLEADALAFSRGVDAGANRL